MDKIIIQIEKLLRDLKSIDYIGDLDIKITFNKGGRINVKPKLTTDV